MRNIPWVRWSNSFGFITIVVFSFAVLTMLVFPASEGNVPITGMQTLVKDDGGQSLGRFKTITASRNRESTDAVSGIHEP